MTQNMIAFKRAEEEERANAAKEAETKRHNRHMEANEYLKNVFGKGGVIGATGSPVFKPLFNHPEWYNQFPQLVADAANFAFTTPLGKNYVLPNLAVPALHAQFDYIPYLGTLTGTDTDPITVAAVGIFAKIREKISGSRPYDRNDVMQVLLAVENIYTRLVEVMRAIKSLNMANIENNAVGSLGRILWKDSYEVAIKEKANLISEVNTLCSKLANLPMPTDIPYFIRHMWLSAHVFADSDQPKFRVITYNCVGRVQYKWSTATLELTESKLRATDPYAYLSEIEADLNAILDSEDVATILGDIRRAYEGSLASLAPISADDTIEFIYSEEVLSQLESGRIHGYMSQPWVVSQSGQNLVYETQVAFVPVFKAVGAPNRPYLTSAYTANINKCHYIDYNNIDDVKPEWNMVATRFMTNVTIASDAAKGEILTIDSAGSEILTNVEIHFRSSSNGLLTSSFTYGLVTAVSQDDFPQYVYVLNQMNYLPKLALVISDGGDALTPATVMNFRPHYFANVSEESVALLNNIALLSELAIASTPETGYSGSSRRGSNKGSK